MAGGLALWLEEDNDEYTNMTVYGVPSVEIGIACWLEEDRDEYDDVVVVGVEAEIPPTPQIGLSRVRIRRKYIDRMFSIEVAGLNFIVDDTINNEVERLNIIEKYRKEYKMPLNIKLLFKNDIEFEILQLSMIAPLLADINVAKLAIIYKDAVTYRDAVETVIECLFTKLTMLSFVSAELDVNIPDTIKEKLKNMLEYLEQLNKLSKIK